MYRSTRAKINKKTELEQYYRLIGPHRHKNHTVPNSSRIHILKHTKNIFQNRSPDNPQNMLTNLRKFSHHSGMKLEISSKQKTGKFTNMLKLNNTLEKPMGKRKKNHKRN